MTNTDIKRKTPLLIILLMMGLVWGCGKKTPPVSWQTVVPKRIVDLSAISREGHILLEWSVPKENTDKSPLTDLAELKVTKSEGILIAGECRGCGEKPQVIYQMKFKGEEETKGQKISIILENLEARKVYVYEVTSVNRRGYAGAPSNPVTVYWDHPLSPPQRVIADRGDKRIDLSWDPVESATGYNVYRRENGQEEFSLRPLNREPLTTTRYADLNVENDKKYVYTVRTVRRVVKTDVEGKGTLGVPVAPTDLIPPGAPVGLVAIPLKEGIELNWARNQEPDLLGYYVYRRKPDEKEFKRLNESPLTKETYLDKNVELGHEYEYAVTAVDNSARRNESPLSESVRIQRIY